MKVVVIGAGTMGSGIAQVASTYENEVVLYDTNKGTLVKSKTALTKIMGRLVEKKKISQNEADLIQSRIDYTHLIDDLANADLVIEAVVENEEIKKLVFESVEALVSQDCIIATNTSSLSVTSLAASLEHSHRFIGLHFFNPVPLMPLVEVIPAIQTTDEVVAAAEEIMKNWRKLTVRAKDTPGFIVNKVARPYYGEALRILDEGLTKLPFEEAIATIDWALTDLGGFKMGPFTLMDFIGNDINYKVTETVFGAFNYDGRYRPSFTQKKLFEAGYFGRKSGRGFYHYNKDEKPAKPTKDKDLGQYIVDRIVAMLINEAADTLHYQIAGMEDIDLTMTKGVRYPKGLFAWADEIGIGTCVLRIDDLYNEYHEERYRCSPLLRKMAVLNESFY